MNLTLVSCESKAEERHAWCLQHYFLFIAMTAEGVDRYLTHFEMHPDYAQGNLEVGAFIICHMIASVVCLWNRESIMSTLYAICLKNERLLLILKEDMQSHM